DPTRPAIVGWRSPIDGAVRVSGQILDGDTSCGNGIKWWVDKGSSPLASGTGLNGQSQTLSPNNDLFAIPFPRGDFLYILVAEAGAVSSFFSCDNTNLDLRIDQVTPPAGPTSTPAPTLTPTSTPTPSLPDLRIGNLVATAIDDRTINLSYTV